MPFAGICDRPPLCLSASPAESEVLEAPREHGSLQSSPSMAAGEAKPEEATLLDHPHLSILPWEDSTLETLSPRLTIGAGSGGGTAEALCDPL